MLCAERHEIRQDGVSSDGVSGSAQPRNPWTDGVTLRGSRSHLNCDCPSGRRRKSLWALSSDLTSWVCHVLGTGPVGTGMPGSRAAVGSLGEAAVLASSLRPCRWPPGRPGREIPASGQRGASTPAVSQQEGGLCTPGPVSFLRRSSPADVRQYLRFQALFTATPSCKGVWTWAFASGPVGTPS